MDDVIEHEEMVETNLEPIGDGSAGVDEVDQSVELRYASEGGQLVNRRQVESRRGFPGGETGEMEIVQIQETRNQDIGVRTGPGARRKVTEFASKANLAENGWNKPEPRRSHSALQASYLSGLVSLYSLH